MMADLASYVSCGGGVGMSHPDGGAESNSATAAVGKVVLSLPLFLHSFLFFLLFLFLLFSFIKHIVD